MVLKMAVLSTRVLGLLNQKKLIRGQMRNSDKTLLGLELQHEGAKTITGPLACSLRGGASWSLKWGEGRGGSSGPARGVGCVQGSGTVSCFCSPHLRSGSCDLVFLYLVHNLPQLLMHTVIFGPL